MPDVPAVSVVIPLYNKSLYIARALNSVLAQTFQEFEVVVVDDGSTDDGAEIVRRFNDPRIQLIQQENQGVSAARNRGIDAARADLVAFLDADDEWLTDHLETLQRLYKIYPDAGACTTAYRTINPNSRIKTPKYYAIPKKPWEGIISNYFRSAAIGFPPVCASAVGIPKNILIEVGGFNTNEYRGEDLDLWARIAIKYPIAFSWEGIVIYHTEATNRACNRIEPHYEDRVIVNTIRKMLESDEIHHEIRKSMFEYLAKLQIDAAWTNYRANRTDLARQHLKKCVSNRFLFRKYWALFWTLIPVNIFYMVSNMKNKLIMKFPVKNLR